MGWHLSPRYGQGWSADTLFWQLSIYQRWCPICVQYQYSFAPKLARKIEHWFSCGTDGRAGGVRRRNKEYFMEKLGVRYLRTSWRIRNRKNEHSERPWDFWYKNNECVNTLRSTFHVVLCLLYTYWDSHHFGGLFISNHSKILKFAATHRAMITKSKYQLQVKKKLLLKI